MSDLVTADETTLIDLSIGLEDGVASEPTPPSIDAFDHEAGAERLAETLQAQGYDVDPEDFPDGMGLAWEDLAVIPTPGPTSTRPGITAPRSTANRRRRSRRSPRVVSWKRSRPRFPVDGPWRGYFGAGSRGRPRRPGSRPLAGRDRPTPDRGRRAVGRPEYLTEFPGMSAEGDEVPRRAGREGDRHGRLRLRQTVRGDGRALRRDRRRGRTVAGSLRGAGGGILPDREDGQPRRATPAGPTCRSSRSPSKSRAESAGWVRPVALIGDETGGETA